MPPFFAQRATSPPEPARKTNAVTWLNMHPRAFVAGLLFLYLGIVVAQAVWKLLWADELITFYVSRQPGLAGIWHALQAGADPNPPLLHVLVKASTSLFGDTALALRLPSIAASFLTICAMWTILRRWVSPLAATSGILAFMATRGFDYSYDARSYALLAATAMLSLAFYLAACGRSGTRRVALLAAMSLALAAGISSNYYGVLAFFPIAAAELTTLVQTKKFRPAPWLALLLAALPLFLYLPLIRHNLAEFVPHAWNRVHPSMMVDSYFELVEGIFWPVLGLATYVFWKTRRAGALFLDHFPAPARAALITLLLYPLLGFAVAKLGAGMISPRCVIPVCCAVGLLAGLCVQSLNISPSRILGAVAFLLFFVLARQAVCAAVLTQQRHAFLRLRDSIAAYDVTTLVADSSFALPLYFYSGEKVRGHLIYPIDFDAIHHFEADDSGEQNLWAGRNGVFPFPIVPLAQSPLTTRHLYLIGRTGGWLAQHLEQQGFTLYDAGSDTERGGGDWDNVGGVFSPMAHPDTRLLEATRE